ncbi:hypothetical protein I4U23_000161 [Adineta vaga]|nr:hypothetical protein I4U23_000161 [Adineta vaga]
MNSTNIGIGCQSSSTINIDGQRQEQRRNKLILRTSLVVAIGFLLSTLITVIIYVSTRKQQETFISSSSINIPVSVLNPCINQSVVYVKAEELLQNFTLYTIDATLIIPEAIISLNITINPPNVGCTWSLDIFPMDGRIIPTSGRTKNSAFGRYDLDQDSTVQYRNAGSLKDWSAGTGKFIVGITGAWYGTASIGCKGNGTMTLCFSHP